MELGIVSSNLRSHGCIKLLYYFDLCYDCTTWYLFLSAVSRHSSLSIFVSSVKLPPQCQRFTVLLWNFLPNKQYNKGMGQVYTRGEADLHQWLCVANGHLLWTIGGWFRFFGTWCPFFAITLHFYLQMLINWLFRVLLLFCVPCSANQLIFTGIFYYSASEPTLKQSSPRMTTSNNGSFQEIVLGTVASLFGLGITLNNMMNKTEVKKIAT